MPAELVHMICSYLTPIQVASIRIVSGMIAAIGLEYIATTVTLTLKEDSFDRLLEIAHHPVISKYVYSLIYEHDFLLVFSQSEWKENITTPEAMALRYPAGRLRAPRAPGINDSPRAWRAFHRECSVFKVKNKYGKKRLDQAFSTYQKLCAEQGHAARSDFFSKKLTDALQDLPNLRTIYMPANGSFSRYQMEVARFLNGALYDQYINQSGCSAVNRSVLLAVDQAIRARQNRNNRVVGLGHGAFSRASNGNSSSLNDDDAAKSYQVSSSPGSGIPNGGCSGGNELGDNITGVLRIKHFSSESFDMRLLLEDDEIFTAMKRGIHHLTKLRIGFLSDYTQSETLECLRRERLYEFVKSAPFLEELDISFPTYRSRTINLTNVVGSFRWESLTTIHFECLQIGVSSLGEFCSRHSSTLYCLSLGDLQMQDISPGENPWYLMFTKIREATKLKKARVYGEFTGSNYLEMSDHRDVCRRSGTLIGRYLVGEGGNSSLEDFLKDERARMSEQDGVSSVSDTDDVSSSETEDSSSE